MIEMTIDSLRVGMMNPKSTQHGTPYVVLLKEKAGKFAEDTHVQIKKKTIHKF